MTHADGLPVLPDRAHASKLGREALRDGRFDAAADHFEQAISGRQDAAIDDLLGLAEARHWQGRYAEVERLCHTILDRDPAQRDARALIGIALSHLDDPASAVDFLLKAPDHPAIQLGMARALDRLGQFGEAETSARRALALAADFPGALAILATILNHQGRRGEALTTFSRALKAEPDNPAVRLAWAEARLALGHADAWSDLALRLKVDGGFPPLPDLGPSWDGEPIPGKTLLLIADRDPGDSFLLVRFAASLKKDGIRVLLACPADVAPLLSTAEGVERVISDLDSIGESIDFHSHLVTLPGLLRLTPADMLTIPYLRPDPDLAATWAAEIAALPGDYKVAIHHGGPADRRSLPTDAFRKIADVNGASLISAQNDQDKVEFPYINFGTRLDRSLSTYPEIAAMLPAVDLLITNDAPIAHLAGALGVPTWVALPVGPDWRWMTDRTDSPWYPSLRLFRQNRLGDWSEVFASMETMLRAGVACRAAINNMSTGGFFG